MSFSGHLSKKIYVAKIKEKVFAQYMNTLLSSLEMRPLLPSSLSHLILNMSVNVTFTDHRGSNPCIVSTLRPLLLPTGSPITPTASTISTPDGSHTWSPAWACPLILGGVLYSLLVMGGVGTKIERPSR